MIKFKEEPNWVITYNQPVDTTTYFGRLTYRIPKKLLKSKGKVFKKAGARQNETK